MDTIKIFKNFSLFLISLFTVIYLLLAYDKYLDKQIDLFYNPALGRTYGLDEMNKGIKILKHSAYKDNLIILGSSELDSVASIFTNPAHMFPNTELNSEVNLVGRAYVQSLLDSMKIAALFESFKEKKIVLIVSLQWFYNKEINKNGYKAHFSELQFYETMDNKNLNDNIKNYICERTVSLTKNELTLERPYLYASVYQKNKILFNVLKPYYFVRKKFLSLKDKHNSYKKIKEFKDKPKQNVRNINWNEEEVLAYEIGKKECNNNVFYVQDDYFRVHLESKVKELKDSLSEVNLLTSKEICDYEIFLKTCSDLGIKPYVIFMPTNGFYYDYIGLIKGERWKLYDELGKMADKYKIDYLDLRDEEYTPYFLKDVMHLGWKGWLYINEKITEHYKEN